MPAQQLSIALDRPVLLLVDGHSLAFRAYYAFGLSKRGAGALRTASGIPTSVCFGFLNSLLQVIEAEKPQAIAIAFDRREKTFRHEADPNYKGDREAAPEDFVIDLNNLQTLLQALNLHTISYAGYEADDILGTLSHQGSKAGYQVKILSGDRDLFQLVNEQQYISVLYPSRNPSQSGGYQEFDEAGVEEKLGVTPKQVVDYKALCGDKSDCIPGVSGIGEKTAVKLLKEYPTLAAIYDNLAAIKGAVKKKLEAGHADAIHSQKLAQIVVDMPLELDLDALQLTGIDGEKLVPLLKKLELQAFLNRLPELHRYFGGEALPVPTALTNNPSSSTAIASQQGASPIPFASSLEPQIITTKSQLLDLIHTLKQHQDGDRPVAWDTETDGLDPFVANLVGIGCAWGKNPDDVAYIPIAHREGEQLSLAMVLEHLRPILESPIYPKVLQNAKFDRRIFSHQGVQLQGITFDTMLASYVLHPELTHNLTDLCRRYLPDIVALSYKDLGLKKNQTIADLDPTIAAHYCGLDCHSTYLLVPKLQAALEKDAQLTHLFRRVEMPLEPILAQMEDQGICIDCDYLHSLSDQLGADLAQLENAAYELAGEKFNLSSPKQLGEILFERLELDRKKSRKTKTGYSTNHATLEKLQGDHPIIDLILEHRTLSKLKSTYVDALPALVNPKTHRLHTDFNQAVTATGRLSSSNPNLQNIPIRSAFSRQIRQAFIPRDNWLLVSADYSQIELRILAHLSQEPVLLQAYGDRQDVHAVTAKLLFDKEDITPAERNLGKTINFGVIYGMGAQRFAREAKVSAIEGREFIDRYRRTYAQVFEFLESMKQMAIAQGYVSTIMGRRRHFEFVTEALRQLRGSNPEAIVLDSIRMSYGDAQLLRSAANAPIQGSSADIIKEAMVKLAPRLEPHQTRMLLQVHDELIFEMPPEEWDTVEPIIRETMESAAQLSVPLEVSVHQGKNWMAAK